MDTIRSVVWQAAPGSRPLMLLKLGLLGMGLVLALFGSDTGITFACGDDGGSCE